MDFGIMFFRSVAQDAANDKYKLLRKAVKFADKNGFSSVWIPERHFHQFGGLFPNPAVVGAGIAMITKNLHIRAGSVVSPLHNPIRIAEEWSVVDNLSGGRVSISFGSGWNVNDFVFFPDRYQNRDQILYQQIETIRQLWRGNSITQKNTYDKEVQISIYPKPIQKELPVWITSSGNVNTFIRAGSIGANLLTHMEGQDIETLAKKIEKYRESLSANQFSPSSGIVTLMLHTFVGLDIDEVKAKVRGPMRDYLRSAVSLELKAAAGGGTVSGGHKIEDHEISDKIMDELVDIAFDRYFDSSSLMGTPAKCIDFLWKLREIGVNEIACLIDFLDDEKAILKSLKYLCDIKHVFYLNKDNKNTKDLLDDFTEELDG